MQIFHRFPATFMHFYADIMHLSCRFNIYFLVLCIFYTDFVYATAMDVTFMQILCNLYHALCIYVDVVHFCISMQFMRIHVLYADFMHSMHFMQFKLIYVLYAEFMHSGRQPPVVTGTCILSCISKSDSEPFSSGRPARPCSVEPGLQG